MDSSWAARRVALALKEVIRDREGDEAIDLIRALLRIARQRFRDATDAATASQDLLCGCDLSQLGAAIRALSVWLQANNRLVDAQAQQPTRFLENTIKVFCSNSVSDAQLRERIANTRVEIVFTAHPTETVRDCVRDQVNHICDLVSTPAKAASGQRPLLRQLRAELCILWDLEFIPSSHPSVEQEIEWGNQFCSVMWRALPQMMADLEAFVPEIGSGRPGDALGRVSLCTWMGGDRDGHPGVTASVTSKAFAGLQLNAIDHHVCYCDSLSAMSSDTSVQRWLQMIRERLEASRSVMDLWPGDSGQVASQDRNKAAYGDVGQLQEDLGRLWTVVEGLAQHSEFASALKCWRLCCQAFGFQLAKLDVRQSAAVYRRVADELFRQMGVCQSPELLCDSERCDLLTRHLDWSGDLADQDLSEEARETLALFRTLHRVADRWSLSAIGAHVVSMTSAASDVMTVLWLWHVTSESTVDDTKPLPIIPQLETVEDLNRGGEILSDLFANSAYRNHLRLQDDRQCLLLGYADSTKVGGYLSASWALYDAQKQLTQVARDFGVHLDYFHGRGESFGRGGGPIDRMIRALPTASYEGRIRLTEQGEALTKYYGDVHSAYRRAELILCESLLRVSGEQDEDEHEWKELIHAAERKSYQAYRGLLDSPGFVEFFRAVTPIVEVERLPIGSRPSRRKPRGTLEDLRAIPWVFSWNQIRCLVPGWYGIGAGFEYLIDDPDSRGKLQVMFRAWPYFRSLIENAESALELSSLEIMSAYFQLVDEGESGFEIRTQIESEYLRSCRVVETLTGRDPSGESTTPNAGATLHRNLALESLHRLQIELLRRKQCGEVVSHGAIQDRVHHTIQGIAAGLRFSG